MRSGRKKTTVRRHPKFARRFVQIDVHDLTSGGEVLVPEVRPSPHGFRLRGAEIWCSGSRVLRASCGVRNPDPLSVDTFCRGAFWGVAFAARSVFEMPALLTKYLRRSWKRLAQRQVHYFIRFGIGVHVETGGMQFGSV